MNALSRWLTFNGQRRTKYLGCLALPLILLLLARPSRSADIEPTTWCHKVSWTTISSLSHTNRRDFPLGMGQATWPGQPVRTGFQGGVDAITDCSLASEAGIDAFAIDILVSHDAAANGKCLDGYMNAAATVYSETGKPFFISPCLDTPSQLTPAALAGVIQNLMAMRSTRPEWPKFEGTPILWTYNGTSGNAAYWKQTFLQLAALKVKVIIVLDGCSLFATATAALPTTELNTYATLPVALYAFRTDFNPLGMTKCRQYLSAHAPTSTAARLTIGTIFPGYWSQTNGWYVDPQGTVRIRSDFDAAKSSRWVTVTSWDDYAETTEFQPSIGLGTGRLDLLHSLLAQRGGGSWPSISRFYLWQPNEIHLGENVSGEALALVASGPATVQVNLCDKNQQVLVAGTPITFKTPGVHAVPYLFPVTDMPANRVAYVSLVCQASDFPQQSFLSEPVCVWPSGDNPWRTLRGTMWQAGKQSGTGPQMAVTLKSGFAAGLSATWPAQAGQMLLQQNFNLVDLPSTNVAQETYTLNSTLVLGPYPWDIFNPTPTATRWGFFDGFGVTPDGTVCWSEPTWVEPLGGYSWVTSLWHFNEGAGNHAADATPYANSIQLKGTAAWGSAASVGRTCLSLDGKNAYAQLPSGIFPKSDFTLAMQVMPVPDTGVKGYTREQFLFCDVNASLILRIRDDGRLMAMRMTDDGTWSSATGNTVVPLNQWSQVTVTYDQQNLTVYLNGRSEAAAPCEGMRINTLTVLGINPAASNRGYFHGRVSEVQIQANSVAPAAN